MLHLSTLCPNPWPHKSNPWPIVSHPTIYNTLTRGSTALTTSFSQTKIVFKSLIANIFPIKLISPLRSSPLIRRKHLPQVCFLVDERLQSEEVHRKYSDDGPNKLRTPFVFLINFNTHAWSYMYLGIHLPRFTTFFTHSNFPLPSSMRSS